MSAGVIGLGSIGKGVASCLARSRQLASVYDLRSEAMGDFPAELTASSPAELASRSKVSLIAVVNGEQVLAVLQGADGILAGAGDGHIVVILSTISIEHLGKARELGGAKGIAIVDCGVTNGSRAAEHGLTCLVGAESDIFDQIHPILEGFARLILHMGAPGAGMAAKLVHNLTLYQTWHAGCEGARIGRAANIDLAKVSGVIMDTLLNSGGPMIWATRPSPARSSEHDLRETIATLLKKDLGAAMAFSETLGIALPGVALTHQNVDAMLFSTPSHHSEVEDE